MTPQISSVGAVVVAAGRVAQGNRSHFSASARSGKRRKNRFTRVSLVAVQYGYPSPAQWQTGQCLVLGLLPPTAGIKASSRSSSYIHCEISVV